MRPEMHAQVTSPSVFSDNNVIQRTPRPHLAAPHVEIAMHFHLYTAIPDEFAVH